MNHYWKWPYIEGIIFCKFDEELGPIVLCKSPSEMFETEKSQFFSLITRYLLPDAHFEGTTISFVVEDTWRAIGVPIFIEGSQYLRNSFQFTICIIVRNNNRNIYSELYARHIARILGSAFKQLEEDCGILYYYCTYPGNLEEILKRVYKKMDDMNDCPRNISEVIEKVRVQLNQYQEVCFDFCKTNSLSFRVRPPSYKFKINAEDVPLSLKKNSLRNIEYIGIDISFLQILPLINGINTVYEISKLCSLPLGDVIICLEHLIFYKLIEIVDVFSIKNKYRYIGNSKDETNILYQKLSLECCNGGNVETFTKKYRNELLKNNIRSMHKFISIGVAKKKITRLHEYPIIFQETLVSCSKNEKKLLEICNGDNNLDYIQIVFGFDKKSDIINVLNEFSNNKSSVFWAYL